MTNYTIGITTYSYRYDKYLIKLLPEIRKTNQNEIILAINGNYRENFSEDYRKNVLTLSTKYDCIFPFIYPNFRSLAKMWNNIVINSSNEYVLLLNDDNTITNPIFFDSIEKLIEKYQTSFKMDKLFCYFVVKKSELNELGWFDERFLGIGGEDNEFEERYEKYFKRKIINIDGIQGIKTHMDNQNAIVNQRHNGKYSQFNQEIYNQHLEPITQYPHEQFYWDNYNKL